MKSRSQSPKSPKKRSTKVSRSHNKIGSSCSKLTGYCVVCKRKVKMTGGKIVKLRNSRKACKTNCSSCGTKVYRFVKN